jgi:hypothetical protein
LIAGSSPVRGASGATPGADASRSLQNSAKGLSARTGRYLGRGTGGQPPPQPWSDPWGHGRGPGPNRRTHTCASLVTGRARSIPPRTTRSAAEGRQPNERSEAGAPPFTTAAARLRASAARCFTLHAAQQDSHRHLRASAARFFSLSAARQRSHRQPRLLYIVIVPWATVAARIRALSARGRTPFARR